MNLVGGERRLAILEGLRKELAESSDEKVRDSGQRFFKEQVKLYGVRNAVVWKITDAHFRGVKDLGKEKIFALCEELLGSGYLEESFVACGWSYKIRAKYEEGDLATFEGWVSRHVSNWATCDTLCNHTVGAFMDKFPRQVCALKGWARSPNMWLRRGAAVSLVLPARRGRFLGDALEIADILMEDEEDLVQKGYGWLLKEASKAHRSEVFDYVMKNRSRMSRTALRYAIEKLPPGMRAEAMKR